MQSKKDLLIFQANDGSIQLRQTLSSPGFWLSLRRTGSPEGRELLLTERSTHPS